MPVIYNAETVAFVSLYIVHQVYSPPAKCTSALAAMTVTEVELKGFEEHSLYILEISEWKRANDARDARFTLSSICRENGSTG
ncbi:hypothetical protein ccbrp13_13150 [Ktedonobacteria bacterium brp13]|nr:hypothetical protein ccbrp13_13150 [Ktedonobacteria bacterium brp13]